MASWVTGTYSHVDRLWTVTPVVYAVTYAATSGRGVSENKHWTQMGSNSPKESTYLFEHLNSQTQGTVHYSPPPGVCMSMHLEKVSHAGNIRPWVESLFATTLLSGGDPRCVLMSALAVLWGIRLTFNFARKGGYSAGEEAGPFAMIVCP